MWDAGYAVKCISRVFFPVLCGGCSLETLQCNVSMVVYLNVADIFLNFVSLRRFAAYKSHPLMGVASIGTGAVRFLSFFIFSHLHFLS